MEANNLQITKDMNCKCCDGKGVQCRLDGIKVICPGCNGTGESHLVNQNIKKPVQLPAFPNSNGPYPQYPPNYTVPYNPGYPPNVILC